MTFVLAVLGTAMVTVIVPTALRWLVYRPAKR